MNNILKAILLGLLIWVVPFVTSIFVWNVEAGAPAIPWNWFSALMAITWGIAFAIALTVYFRKTKLSVTQGWRVGVIWFVVPSLLDFIVLFGVFGNPFMDVLPIFVTYLNALLFSVVLGYLGK